MTRLSTVEWEARASAHRERAERHTLPVRKRRDHARPHPVEDFLFQYYPYSFALLEQWHPGTGVILEMPGGHQGTPPPALPAAFSGKYYTADAMGATSGHRRSEAKSNGIRLDTAKLGEKERARLEWVRSLLEATRGRPPVFSCHGLHEWAMVYRGKEVRHEKTTPLRLPQTEIDALVESRAICCTHHDAFRFFAPEARPMNRLQPSLDTRILLEQPGCVHANMDLYKWAAKGMPWIGSDLLMDCFELALELRELDMRASPYDLMAWGYEPVKIETAEGRKDYEAEQRRLAGKAAPLRERLIGKLDNTLSC